ncbi:MAG: cyclodeaminase/cyclohydrolase family protein [Solobacterium sp.]|nr:cyclodeaminase/cyclohydrolase family protein [Solobacterium sp.]MBQ6356297.1 cyclodeaminase/cyclohydrolase family protein [Solobacterium sp.]MBQ6532406.1 cyclodeaminase/cyclohydrolase family protein [Solobacterium sp.]MBR0214406.1 cyclodeaminase/cyclohydrolase family protein [Solobacterium sp.]
MMLEKPFTEFTAELGSASPVPGGGGAAAAAGALAVSLGRMVASLTTGKKKYAAYEEDMQRILNRCTQLQGEFILLADRDAECFAPLAAAYRLPKDTPEQAEHKQQVMEQCLREACTAPLDIMRAAVETVAILEELAEKGSRLALSDAAAGAVLARACLQAASLNVFINTKMMLDRTKAGEINTEAEAMLADGCGRADAVYKAVMNSLK